MPTSICPECHEDVFVEADSEQGERISCDECGSHLVVVGLDPIELDLYEESESGNIDEEKDLDSYDYDDGPY